MLLDLVNLDYTEGELILTTLQIRDSMEKHINKHNVECYRNVTLESEFSSSLFHEVHKTFPDSQDHQVALHTNLGSITVIARFAEYLGYLGCYEVRNIETGYRDTEGNFWLASGDCDVRDSGVKTIGEAIAWVKDNANMRNHDLKG